MVPLKMCRWENTANFLEERLDHFWRRQRGEFRGQTRIEKKIFYFGLLIGFGERLAVESQPR